MELLKQQSINDIGLCARKVLIAPEPLQDAFVNIVAQSREEIQKTEEQNRNLIKQRDLLLPRLMSGKLEV